MNIEEIKKQENRNLAQMCLGNLEQIEKSIIEIEKRIEDLEKIQKIEIAQAKSYIETQKTLFQYFIKEDK